MSQKKLLVQWIGHSDLRALAANSSRSRCEKLMSILGGRLPDKSDTDQSLASEGQAASH
ncbi:hypothetical protein [Rubinisphaera sp.]|uniref:hypothetical protein n=1 Tax=Rubinisphaera sp. TaxID=2024857 RepID=UPI0025E197F1|nr:hypothetical protein [Rubinisphaera sp.]